MVGRFLDTVRSGVVGDGERPPRPNELRRETVQADRLRRDARAARPAPNLSRRTPEEQRPATTRPPTAAAGPARQRQHPLAAALASRADLRRAWLLSEILGPPKALRDPATDLSGGRR